MPRRKKKTFVVGDRVTITVNSAARRVEGTVTEVRADGKLGIQLEDRHVVRSASFAEHAAAAAAAPENAG